eukprot:1791236-Prymnesium_polylepis.1
MRTEKRHSRGPPRRGSAALQVFYGEATARAPCLRHVDSTRTGRRDAFDILPQERCIFHLLETKRRRAIRHLNISAGLRESISLSGEFALTRDGFWMERAPQEDPREHVASSLLLVRSRVPARGRTARRDAQPPQDGWEFEHATSDVNAAESLPAALWDLHLEGLARCIDVGAKRKFRIAYNLSREWCREQRLGGKCSWSESVRLLCARTCDPSCLTVLHE